METFTEPRDFVRNPFFAEHREKALLALNLSTIDPPVVDIVEDFSRLDYCFTLQICVGHFLYPGQNNLHNLDPLPLSAEIQEVKYRIAYLALCIAENDQAKSLHEELSEIPAIDPDYIQFGSADWFWERQVNSYALQVEPRRMRFKDNCKISYQEGLHIEQVRDAFFAAIRKLLVDRLGGE